MGQRANLVVRQGGKLELFYSHWCANRLPTDLFWGPDHALAFIRVQRRVGEMDWLDEIWAEGGVILDADADAVLFYGGEDVMYDVQLRRVFLELMRRVWAGWEVYWAHEGIADLADRVGLPRPVVLNPFRDDPVLSLVSPEEPSWTETVGTIRWPAGRTLAYPLQGDPGEYLLAGEALLRAPGAAHGLERMVVADWIPDHPAGGFHIDVPERTVHFWTARPAAEAQPRAAAAWPGWAVHWLRDEFERHQELAGGSIELSVAPREELERRVIAMLLHESTGSMAESVADLVDQHRREGKSVEVNPLALRDDRLELPIDRRREILALALGRPV